MSVRKFVQRHKVSVASGSALLLATSLLVAYAVNADGYRQHDAELNDGGIWVVSGKLGQTGRINKPINQLDGVVLEDAGDLDLDVVQDGAIAVSVNDESRLAKVIDGGRLAPLQGGSFQLPATGDLQALGGSLAAIDAQTGEVWAVRTDPEAGRPSVTALDSSADPLAKAGDGAALAVTSEGTVAVSSTGKGTLTLLKPSGTAFAKPETHQLADRAGAPTALTAVGERLVSLDAASGQLQIVDGPAVEVPENSVLQQPGAAAEEVLIASADSLLSVDLEDGTISTVQDGLVGQPIAPVHLGACNYGAWGGGAGAVVVQCGDDAAKMNALNDEANNLEFRVNRAQIVLQDSTTGAVWDVDVDSATQIDNWNDFIPKTKKSDEEKSEEQQTQGDRRPPKAENDSYGVRAGRTTVLHPLDNDAAPEGRLLSIRSVDNPGGGATASISPDGQTIQYVAPKQARATSFDYFIDDGRDTSARATITISPRGAAQNEAPTLRSSFEPRVWQVPAGGSISVPVLSDWRDDADGDTIVLDSAKLQQQGQASSARTTADGRIRFTAPQKGSGPVKVDYGVTDANGTPASATLTFDVQPEDAQKAIKPVAEPDVVRGEVGKPIEIRPLANDLPGSDPTSPFAQLSLAGKLQGKDASVKVTTDLATGRVTFRSEKTGTFFLDYDAAYGRAPLDRGLVRVDVSAPAKKILAPVAMPDTGTLYGTAPGLVDALANDVDPAGGVLVIQSARVVDDPTLEVSVVEGRWLRLSSPSATTSDKPGRVRYTVSNGAQSSTGEVTVTHRPTPSDNSPVTTVDRVTVRAGQSVAVPSLDNDVSPSGDRLSLMSTGEGDSGRLEVLAPGDVKGDLGEAFVSGRMVRYLAPPAAGFKEQDTFTINYVAVNTTGDTALGTIEVTVVPEGGQNKLPEPGVVEGRTLANDTVTLRLPATGIDPDGDPVTLTGITEAPRLGRVVSFTGSTLEYQAYPGAGGTDEFSFQVVDTRGGIGIGTMRVAVVPPLEPKAPLAVDDQVTVQPGRVGVFAPLTNDNFDSGSEPILELIDPPEGVERDPDTGLVTIQAPTDMQAPPVQVVYSLSNGFQESRATMTLSTGPEVENPPVVFDAYGTTDDSDVAEANVLDGAYDPDGDAGDLTVSLSRTSAGDDTVTLEGSTMRVVRGAQPRVVPFQVSDADGSVAAASLYVPATGIGLPYVKPDALITMKSGGEFTGKISDYIVNPSGGQLRLAGGRQSVSATPTDLTGGAEDEQEFTLKADGGYRGPGAALLRVTTAVDESGNEDPLDPSDGATALLSVPVQVGDDTPFLRCNQTPLALIPGQEIDLDLTTVCEVQTVDPRDVYRLDYSAAWDTELGQVNLDGVEGSVVSISVDEAADGGTAVLAVRAGESREQLLTFNVAPADPPRLLSIPSQQLRAGQESALDLKPYLVEGLSSAQPTVVSVARVSGAGVTASPSGSRVLLRAPKNTSGRAVFTVVMSDVSASDPPQSRRAVGRIVVEVSGPPQAPTDVYAYEVSATNRLMVRWAPPKDSGGAPITHYVVRDNRSGTTQRCVTSPCAWTKDIGRGYAFQVQAVNRMGNSEWSAQAKVPAAARRPFRVTNIRLASRADGVVKLKWNAPPSSGAEILKYEIDWAGGGDGMEVVGTSTTATIAGLNNNNQYTFAVVAVNKAGRSPVRESSPMQSLGTPSAPSGVNVSDSRTGQRNANQTTVAVSWGATSPQGPGPTTYTVYVSRGGSEARSVSGCVRIQATTCLDSAVPYDGKVHSYWVRASNSPQPEQPNTSRPSEAAQFQATGLAAPWGDITVTPTGQTQTAVVEYTVPDSRGAKSVVTILVGNAEARTFANQRGQVRQQISTDSNYQVYPVRVQVCNENGPSSCSVSAERNVQTYGPLTSGLGEITSVVRDDTIEWTVPVDNNGDEAQLHYEIFEGDVRKAGTTISMTSKGQASQVITYATTWDTRATLRVTLSDSNPGGRGTANASASATTDPVPEPSVNVSKGDSCSDASDAQVPGCDNTDGGYDGSTCTDANCTRLFITAGGFLGAYQCSIRFGYGQWNTVPPNVVNGGPFYYHGGWKAQVTVQCVATSGPEQQGSDTENW